MILGSKTGSVRLSGIGSYGLGMVEDIQRRVAATWSIFRGLPGLACRFS
jgi:hypothetical protein